jgi:23S rRNA (uracil1939-C5)-methyltransferase
MKRSAARETRAADVVDLTHDGLGVAVVDGRRVFVAGALPGERVELALGRRRRQHREAELVRVLEPAPARVVPHCEYFGVCGGCALQHLAPDAQVSLKQRAVAETLTRIGNAVPEEWLAPITGPEWGYRRRARLGVKYVAGKERVLVGFRERAAPYVTDMARCPVLAAPVGALLGELAVLVAATSVRERVPQIEVAVGENAAALVFRVLDKPTAADEALLAEFGRRHDVDIYLQPTGVAGNIVPLGEPRALQYALRAHGVVLRFVPTDFIQVNAVVNARMVDAAIELAEVRSDDRVLDLYCGLGNFSLPFARRAAQVLGVEGDAGLVARAARNAERNGIGNARFVAADLAEPDWPFLRGDWSVIVLDPPRTGAEAPVASLVHSGARKLVYVSCHPATLARDARVLLESGRWRLRYAHVLDMFPHTHHVEVMALFETSAVL